ncbi:MAG: hypothetical protein KBA06_06410 [Saprospiraceae bacterium]|nr:hypothetical protein [Saprospiraceae bacterium]
MKSWEGGQFATESEGQYVWKFPDYHISNNLENRWESAALCTAIVLSNIKF